MISDWENGTRESLIFYTSHVTVLTQTDPIRACDRKLGTHLQNFQHHISVSLYLRLWTRSLYVPSLPCNFTRYSVLFVTLQIARILRNIGVGISDETFDEVWRQACLKDHRGEACVESVRNVLDEMQASQMKGRR